MSIPYKYDYNTESGLLTPVYSAEDTFGNAEAIVVDPIVIDLGKTGFELTSQEEGVYFDMDGNTLSEKTSWITGDDAFLALDRNGDGTINNGGELFGDRTLLKDGTYASSGFEALAEFDENLDGIINAHDSVFNELLLWQDKNGDGISTVDELVALSDAGITAINLGYENINTTDEETGSLLANMSSAVFEDGTETAVGEFKFILDKIDTTESITLDISDEIKALPNVRAIGRVHSLHYEMAMDTSGTLVQLVKQFTECEDIAERESILDDILYFICDATDIDPTSRGSSIDARQLAVIENIIDRDYHNAQTGANPNHASADLLIPLYQELRYAYYSELIYDEIKEYLNFIDVKTNENDTLTYDLSLFNSYVNFQLSYGKINETTLIDIGRYLFNNNKTAFVEFINYFEASNASYASLVLGYCEGVVGTDGDDSLSASTSNIIIGRGGNDSIYGSSDRDILDGGVGNDYLYGDYGDDTYIFNKGYSIDYISDPYGLDTVKFGEGISPDDIVLVKNEHNLELQIKGSEDKVIIDYYFWNDEYSNFKYSFADGTVATVNKETLSFEFPELNNYYAFSSGDGEIKISDSEGKDILQINADILSTIFSRNGDDLDIQLNQTNDKFTVENWFASENNQIESIISNDGYALANNQVQLLIENMSSFTNDNNISWAEAIQQDSSAIKSVLEQIWVKAD